MGTRNYIVDGVSYPMDDSVTPEQAQQILTQRGVLKPTGNPRIAPPPEALGEWQEPDVLSSGLARQGVQGLTLGLGDEIEAGARALFEGAQGKDIGEAYNQNVGSIRSNLDQYRGAHPGVSLGANVVGSLPLMAVPVLNATRGATMLETLGNAARAGVTGGAIAGAGAGEGDWQDRARRAAVGAVQGTLFGAGVPIAGRATGKIAQAVSDVGAGNVVGRVAGMAPGVTAPGVARAEEELLHALQSDGIPLDDAIQVATDWATTGKPFGTVDVGGERTRRLMRAALNIPNSKTNQFAQRLAGRDVEQGARIASDLGTSSGVLSNAVATAKKLGEERDAQAAPLYQAVFRRWRTPTNDRRILEILQRPGIRPVMKDVVDNAATRGTPLATDAAGNPLMNLEALDGLKRGIDARLFDAETGQIDLGSGAQKALNEARVQLLGILDKRIPEYAKARAVYAGPSRSLTAMKAGRKIIDGDVDEVAEMLKTEFNTPAEREHLLLGAIAEIRSRIARPNDNRDIYAQVFGSPQKRDMLKMLFPSEKSFENFKQAMSVEKAMQWTKQRAIGNSNTAAQLADMADLGSRSTDIGDMLTHPTKTLINKLTNTFFNRVKGENAEAILPMMLEENPRDVLRRLQELEARQRARAQGRLATAPGMGSVGGQTDLGVQGLLFGE